MKSRHRVCRFHYPTTSDKVSGESGCWELCEFHTPSDLIPMDHRIKEPIPVVNSHHSQLGAQKLQGRRPRSSRTLMVASLSVVKIPNGHGFVLYEFLYFRRVCKVLNVQPDHWVADSASISRQGQAGRGHALLG